LPKLVADVIGRYAELASHEFVAHRYTSRCNDWKRTGNAKKNSRISTKLSGKICSVNKSRANVRVLVGVVALRDVLGAYGVAAQRG